MGRKTLIPSAAAERCCQSRAQLSVPSNRLWPSCNDVTAVPQASGWAVGMPVLVCRCHGTRVTGADHVRMMLQHSVVQPHLTSS